MTIGYTYSDTGEYRIDEITVVLLRMQELARGDIVYVEHPKNGSPVVYQVTRVYPHKRVRVYEESLLKEGRIIGDGDDAAVHAQAYQWGWMDEDGSLRPLRYPLPPNTAVFRADREVVSQFTKPSGEWKLEAGSGNVTLRLPSTAAFDLHAHTGSGAIESDHPITVQGKVNRHELRGKVRGGGAPLEVSTGSGNIRIE